MGTPAARHAQAPEPEYLDARAVAAVLGLTLAELRALAERGRFAPLLELTRQRALVLVDDVRAWERTHTIGWCGDFRFTQAALRLHAALPPPVPVQGPERPGGADASRDVASLR